MEKQETTEVGNDTRSIGGRRSITQERNISRINFAIGEFYVARTPYIMNERFSSLFSLLFVSLPSLSAWQAHPYIYVGPLILHLPETRRRHTHTHTQTCKFLERGSSSLPFPSSPDRTPALSGPNIKKLLFLTLTRDYETFFSTLTKNLLSSHL